MDERIATLEANIEHVQSDVSEIKVEMREMRKDIQRVDSKVDAVKDAISALELRMEKSFANLNVARMVDRIWFLLMLAGLLVVIARAFKWI